MRGLVVGKFYPFHKGHSYLIDFAKRHCDSLAVLVCNNPRYAIPATTRAQWIAHKHPDVDVLIIPDLEDDDNSAEWASHTIKFLGYAPDIVFSSEEYGILYAQHMNADHVMVDRARKHFPISGTCIRKNLLSTWQYIDDVVKADSAFRIVVVGAESTGTTTLARALASQLTCPWVPEYGRLYSEAIATTNHSWNNDDFIHIATKQQSMERFIASRSDGIIVCDTNTTATQLWQKRYLGHITDEVGAIAQNDIADLYIITGDEIPFVQDGIRDGESIRHDMHRDFVSYIGSACGAPHFIVNGSVEERVRQSMNAIKTARQTNWLTNHNRYAKPLTTTGTVSKFSIT